MMLVRIASIGAGCGVLATRWCMCPIRVCRHGAPASSTNARLKGLVLLLYTELIDVDDNGGRLGARQTSSGQQRGTQPAQHSAARSCPQQFLNIVVER